MIEFLRCDPTFQWGYFLGIGNGKTNFWTRSQR